MKIYKDMIREVMSCGTRKENRTGVDTISTFGFFYKHDMEDGLPLLTTKKINWKNIVVEMLWFLSGSTSIEVLKRHKCKFWDAWADERGNVPSAYGHYWRQFPVPCYEERGSDSNDQLSWVVQQLRANPMSRRLVVSAWSPDNAQNSKLPPCHFAMAFNVQIDRAGEQRLCLHLTQRSCDLALGVPYNMASYGLLLLLMSHLTGIKPGVFAHTLLDLHIYTSKQNGEMAEFDHVPGLTQQLMRECRKLPSVSIDPEVKGLADIEAMLAEDWSTDDILSVFNLRGYDPSPAIRFKVAV